MDPDLATSELTTDRLERPGGHIAYDTRGSGPLVVCIPGMGDVRSVYRFLATGLVEAGFRVSTMDLRVSRVNLLGHLSPRIGLVPAGESRTAALIRGPHEAALRCSGQGTPPSCPTPSRTPNRKIRGSTQ